MNITSKQREELVRRACMVRAVAYAPYSDFRVGASLLAQDGFFFDGVNVENASFGLTCCAERTAIFSAIAAGKLEWIAIAVASIGCFAPCGACRQVMVEFHDSLPILLVDPGNPEDITVTSIDLLLPASFRLKPSRPPPSDSSP